MLKLNKELLKFLIKKSLYYFLIHTNCTLEFDDMYFCKKLICKYKIKQKFFIKSIEEVNIFNSFYIDEETIGNKINNLIIRENELKNYGFNINNKEIKINYEKHFIKDSQFNQFIEMDTEEIYSEIDDIVYIYRIMMIDIEKITDYILNCPYSKPKEEILINLENLSEHDFNEILINPFIKQSLLREELNLNFKSDKFIKI